MQGGQGSVNQTQVAQSQSVVHVTNNHIHTAVPARPAPAQSPDDLFKNVLEFIKSRGYDPRGDQEDSESKKHFDRVIYHV